MKDKILKMLESIRNDKVKRNNFILFIILLIILIGAAIFSNNNESYYKKTIAKVISINEINSTAPGINADKESIKQQTATAVILNGADKGKKVTFKNTVSYSQVNEINVQVNDEVFISVQKNPQGKIQSVSLLDIKRDKYISYITIIFVALMLLIGGSKGFRSLASVAINIVIFLVVVDLFLKGWNVIIISIIASLFFIVLSIFTVCGVNQKTYSAIIGTALGTLISMIIAVSVILLCHWNGVHFEEMEFLTHPPEKIFMLEILVGTLGAIMDIAISISSSISEIYTSNPDIEKKNLIKSGMEIGKDIMGTMANTLVFAFISGGIPTLILCLRNGFSITYVISINLSLEFVRALTGSIGIVLSIPITIYTSVLLIENSRKGRL